MFHLNPLILDDFLHKLCLYNLDYHNAKLELDYPSSDYGLLPSLYFLQAI